MPGRLTIGCVIMAAGSAKRFGDNKLAVEVRGRSLFRRALDAVPVQQFENVVVVTQYTEFTEVVKEYHFAEIFNQHPELGLSRTVQLGLTALRNCDGVLFQVADQPLLRQESVSALCDLWRRQPDSIAALAHQGHRGNPCLFPSRFFPELMEIQGDRGGNVVIQAHPEALITLDVPSEELFDVDTTQALEQLKP